MAGEMMKITGNRKNALWLASLSLALSLLAFIFFTAGVSISLSALAYPVVLILAFAPLAGVLGIIYRDKEVLIISSLMSLALTILGIVSIGFFFVVPSLLLIISTFVYLRDEPVVEVNEKARRVALVTALASLVVAIAATVPQMSFAGSITAALAFGLIFFSFPIISPILGIFGIRNGNKEFLYASCAISLVIAIFLGLLMRQPLFLASSLLLVLSSFAYQDGVTGEFKREMVNARLKKIALLLAGIALVAAMVITLYSEFVLVSGGCYSYKTSTGGGRICSDFRIDYVIPVIISAFGMAGILRENKRLLYASATVSFVRIVIYLQPIASLFLPSFVALIFSAFVYKIGIRKMEHQAEVQENSQHYYLLLLLSAFVIFWIVAVYMFVHPSSIETSGGYGYESAPTKQVP
jgi:MFS family permease